MTAPSPLDDAIADDGVVLNWASRLWVMTFLVGLVVAAGLSPGLQGAFIGAGPVIKTTHLLGSHLSQFTVLLGLLLLVYLAVQTTRVSKNLFIGVGTALLGTIPAVVLYHASRETLPAMISAVSAIVSSLIVLACSAQSKSAWFVKVGALSCGVSLLASVLGYILFERDASRAAVVFTTGLSSCSSWIALGCVFFGYAKNHRPIYAALALISSIIPAAAAQSLRDGAQLDAALATLGHTLSALLGSDVDAARGYGLTLALVLTALSVISPRDKLSLVAASLLTVCAFSPITPAVCAAITLASYLLLVLPNQRNSALSQVSHA